MIIPESSGSWINCVESHFNISFKIFAWAEKMLLIKPRKIFSIFFFFFGAGIKFTVLSLVLQVWSVWTFVILNLASSYTQKMKFTNNVYQFSKCKQIRSFLRICSHLLKKYLTKKFIFCAVTKTAEKGIPKLLLCFKGLIVYEKCPYLELFWFVFYHIRTEYGEILPISPYSARTQQNTDQNNSEYGHFLCSVSCFWNVFKRYTRLGSIKLRQCSTIGSFSHIEPHLKTAISDFDIFDFTSLCSYTRVLLT